MESLYLWSGLVLISLSLHTDADPALRSITAIPGQELTVDCLILNTRILKPPTSCISKEDLCLPYREPLVYLCRGKCETWMVHTYNNSVARGRFSLSLKYFQTGNNTMAALSLTVSKVKRSDSNRYSCGLITPSGYHSFTMFQITGPSPGPTSIPETTLFPKHSPFPETTPLSNPYPQPPSNPDPSPQPPSNSDPSPRPPSNPDPSPRPPSNPDPYPRLTSNPEPSPQPPSYPDPYPRPPSNPDPYPRPPSNQDPNIPPLYYPDRNHPPSYYLHPSPSPPYYPDLNPPPPYVPVPYPAHPPYPDLLPGPALFPGPYSICFISIQAPEQFPAADTLISPGPSAGPKAGSFKSKGAKHSGWRDSPLTVIRVTEGQDVTLECPLKQLLLVNPPASCLLHTDRDVCLPYFQPQLTFHREENPWRGRFTVKFLEMAASVTISELKKDDAGRYTCRVQAPSGATTHSIFQIIVEEPSPLLLLLFISVVVALAVTVAVTVVLLLLICRKKKNSKTNAQRATENLPGTSSSPNLERVTYENCPPPPTYQRLSESTRARNQIYYTLHRV